MEYSDLSLSAQNHKGARVRIKGRLILDVVTFVGFFLAMNTTVTGIPVHEWLSVAVTAVIVVHLLTEWDWTVATVTRFFGRLRGISRVNLVLDILLFVAFDLVMLSGFMVSESIAPMLRLTVPFGPTWKIVHALSADAALIMLGLHAGIHWRWFVSAIRRLARPADLATGEN